MVQAYFCVLNCDPRRETFQPAEALGEKGGQQYDPCDTRVLFGINLHSTRARILSALWTSLTRVGGLTHPLMMFFEMISLIISEVPSPTVLSLASRQCRCTSNSSA